MVKMILFPLIYCIGFFFLSFSSDVNGIGSSISLASAPGIENPKSFSHARAKRALALLMPFDDDDKSSEEHRKSKRCWKARPIQKMRLSLEPEEAKEEVDRTSGSIQNAKYNFVKLYNDEKRSAEESEEEESSGGSGGVSLDDSSGEKLPYLKIVPVNNPRKKLRDFLGTERESVENSEDVILKRIKNHLNSEDYNVLALVGKRAKCHSPNKPRKYVCYCREANCSGGNCQRMTYRPCLTCRNSGPVFTGKVNDNSYANGGANPYYKSQETQSTTDERIPLKIQYPAAKNEFLKYPANNELPVRKDAGIPSPTNDVNKFDRQKFQQNQPAPAHDRRYQFSYDTPRVVLANPNNNIAPLNQYRILHIPVSSKSASESGISSSKIPANLYPPAPGMPFTNEYRTENSKLVRDRGEYNQWAVNPYYPSIGNTVGNLDTRYKNHEINRQNFIKLHESGDGFGGPKTPFVSPGLVAFSHPATPGSQIGKNFPSTEPKMITNLHPILNDEFYNKHHGGNGFGWIMPNGRMTQAHSQQQNIQTPFVARNYQERPGSHLIRTSAELYGKKNHRPGEYVEEKDPQFEFGAGGYDASTEYNFDSVTSLDTKSHTHDDQSREDNSANETYEDSNERQIINDKVSRGENFADIKDRNNFDYKAVGYEPEKYKIPIVSLEKGNPLEANEFSDATRNYEALGSREMYTNRNYINTASGANHEIVATKSPNYDEGYTDYSIDDTSYSTQLEQPANERFNWDQYKYDETTSQTIIQSENDEDVSSMRDYLTTYDDDHPRMSESEKNVQLEAPVVNDSDDEGSGRVLSSEETESQKSTDDDYSDIRVVTNGYFTSQAFDDLGETNNGDVPVTGIGSDYEITHRESTTRHSYSNDEESYTSSSDGQTESGSRNGNVGKSSLNKLQSGREEVEERLIEPGDYSNEIITATEAGSSDEEIRTSKFTEDGSKIITGTTTSFISNVGDGENLQTSDEREYSLESSAESKKAETTSIEVVGRQETDSTEYGTGMFNTEGNYELRSSTEEDTLKPNEEDGREDPDELSSLTADGKNFGGYSSSKSIESHEDVFCPEKDFTEYSMEENPVMFNERISESPANELVGTENAENSEECETENYYNRIDEEPGDVAIENSPIKYFSPNDRVLEYIKKHGQNLVREFDACNDEQRRAQATPIYPSEAGRETQYFTPDTHRPELGRDESTDQDYEGYNSGPESEEMITRLSKNDGNDWYDYEIGNSGEQTSLDVDAGREFPVKKAEIFTQDLRSQELDNVRMSDCGRHSDKTESIVRTEPRDENPFVKSEELQGSPNKMHRIEPSQILTTNFSPEGSTKGGKEYEDFDVEEYHSKTDLNEGNETYEGEADDHAEEFHGTEGSESNYRTYSGTERSTEITTGYDNNAEEPTSPYILGKLQHLGNSDYESTEESREYETAKYSTERSGDFYTNGEVHSAIEQPKKSILTHAPMDISTSYCGSTESTEASVLLGGSREQNLGFDNERSGIFHTRKGFSPYNYDYVDSTESSRSGEESVESGTDYGITDLIDDKYKQYNEMDIEPSIGETSSLWSHRPVDEKSTTESYGMSKKLLMGEFLNSHSGGNVKTNEYGVEIGSADFRKNDRSSEENVDDFGVRTNIQHENIVPDMNSGITSFDKARLDQYVGTEKYAVQSTTQNSKPDDVVDQNKFDLQHRAESEEENYPDLTDEDSGGYDVALEKYNPIESQRSSTETTNEDVEDDSKYYTRQGTRNTDDFYSSSRSEDHDESRPRIYSERNLGQVQKSEKDSSETKNVQFASSSQSVECCTKPPEVQGDVGYLGRLEPKKSNADAKSLGDLVDSDLYYIGDGVKLPLTIKKLKDGSFALSISDKICEQRIKDKCPCCVPREGRILQEKHDEINTEQLTGRTYPSSLQRRAIPDGEKTEVDDVELGDVENHEEMSERKLNVVEKVQDHSRRNTRSISMPVDEFAEKYNLILNLNDRLADGGGDLEAAEFSLRHNAILRDEAKDEIERGNGGFVEKLVSINDVPENERAGVLLSTLEKLIVTEPTEVFQVVNGIKQELRGVKSAEDNRDEGKYGGEKARYGYQRDNPILDRIKIIKQMQKEVGRCGHRYQKDCDDAITQKTELLIMILHWLKDLIENKPN